VDEPDPATPDPVGLPITRELDLHAFQPREIGGLLREYLRVCRERGIFEVRVVHGKGTGQLARTVHSVLAKMPEVASFSLATQPYGGAGATFVKLRPASES
jgi:DNA-nicking Smr family endonuclease